MKKKMGNKKICLISVSFILAGICLLIYSWSIGLSETESANIKEEVLSFAIYGNSETEMIVRQAVQSFQELNHCKVEVYCYGTEEEEEDQVLG